MLRSRRSSISTFLSRRVKFAKASGRKKTHHQVTLLPRSSWLKNSAKFGLESATCARPAPCESPFFWDVWPSAWWHFVIHSSKIIWREESVYESMMSLCHRFAVFFSNTSESAFPWPTFPPAEGSCCAPAGSQTQTCSDNLYQSASLPLGCDSGLWLSGRRKGCIREPPSRGAGRRAARFCSASFSPGYMAQFLALQSMGLDATAATPFVSQGGRGAR